jgi:two-component system NarL family response regulator
MPPEGMGNLVDSIVDIDTYHPTLTLTPYQVRLLDKLASGGTYTTVAEDTAISKETVKTNVKIIREKLGARNTTHAVAIAMREGIIV